MPRESIRISQRIEYLSVLNADGELDRALEPKISDDDLRRLYKFMMASRLLDERAFKMQRQGRVGTFAPCRGQEAASLGVAYGLTPDDWMVPSFRENAAMLWRGWPMNTSLYFFGGFEKGAVPPDDVNDTPICVPVASQCQYAMGIAWGLKLRGKGQVCAAFCGDGGTSEGDFHEAMNFAAVYQMPLIMVIQNNHWAISLPRDKQTATPTIAQKAVAYGMDAIQADGNDLLAMIVAMRESVEKARTGGGPTLIEAVTYRLGVHTTADDPRKYRTEDEVNAWEPRDPILRFRQYLRDKRLLDEQSEQMIADEIQAELDESTEEYESYRPEPYELFKHMYAEMTPELRAQYDELRAQRRAAEPEEAPTESYSRVL